MRTFLLILEYKFITLQCKNSPMISIPYKESPCEQDSEHDENRACYAAKDDPFVPPSVFSVCEK